MKIIGAKEALMEFNEWLRCDWRHSANIMLDKSTGEVWTDCFLDCNQYKIYHSESIISLSHFITIRTGEPLTAEILEKYASIAITEEE